jgi:hypothetical protein
MARRKDPGKAAPPDKPPAKQPPRKPDRAFDVWLDRGLHSMFDSVASEPIPDELLRLIEEDRKK